MQTEQERDFEIGDYIISLNEDDTACIEKYSGFEHELIFPDSVNGYKVTSIGDEACFRDLDLISVIIPKGVTSIGWMAFFDCINLSHVTIPSGVTTIEAEAFQWCSSLTEVIIPESVTEFGRMAFANCANLTLIVTHGSCAEEYARQEKIPYKLIT